MDNRRIALYGNNVIIGTFVASLRRSSQYEVIPFFPAQQNELEAMAPDVVFFDLEGVHVLRRPFLCWKVNPALC